MPLHLFLSPHFDDAVLSCAGLIYRQVQAGDSALVLTVFAGAPPAGARSASAEPLAEQSQTPEAYVAARQAEDGVAVESLGASWLHWEYPDCIYRLAPDGDAILYADEAAIFGEVHPAERAAFAGELALRLQALCDELRPATVCAPLTVGHHVDHQLVQWAARLLTSRGWELRFYEDYTYVEVPGSLEATLATLGGPWPAELVPLTAEALAAKVEAIACYKSQIAGLFGDEAALRERVKSYAHSLASDGPAERYWRLGAR